MLHITVWDRTKVAPRVQECITTVQSVVGAISLFFELSRSKKTHASPIGSHTPHVLCPYPKERMLCRKMQHKARGISTRQQVGWDAL